MLLEPIYEGEFHDFSFGFRTGKSADQALDYLHRQCYQQEVSYILDVDVRKYFDMIDHRHLREILDQRVRDGVLRRLIDKWLKAGVWEEGRVHTPETGSPQGGVISPVLSNIYLHTVLDEWYVTEIREQLEGKSLLVRYADDFVMGFSDKSDAENFQQQLKERFANYGLEIHRSKTRLVRFKRPSKYTGSDKPKPGSFDFLGFTHYWGISRKGNNVVCRKTSGKRFTRSLKAIKEWGYKHRSLPLKQQQEQINRQLIGHYSYYGITGNIRSLNRLRIEVQKKWRNWLGRRTRKGRANWKAFNSLLRNYPLVMPKIAHGDKPLSESII